jgi:hypothetical protein
MYVLICHNFLIGKGHTCALRTTCVLGGGYEPWYVHKHVRTFNVMSQLHVLIMLCHNFLIGKGHTCALRTTYVLGGYEPWYVHVYVRTYNIMSQLYVHVYL